MKTRILTGAVLVVLLVATFLLAETFVLPLVCAVLAMTAAYELAGVFGLKKSPALLFPSAVFAFFVTALTHVTDKDALLLLPEKAAISPLAYFGIFALFLLALVFYIFTYGVLTGGRVRFSDTLAYTLMVLYATVGFASLSMLVRMGSVYLAILVFIGSWISDTFAYFTGRLLGKHKLSPTVSPKKTVEGSIGGILFAALFALAFGLILEALEAVSSVNIVLLLVAGAALSVASQIGDLTASLLKREYGIKDYGRIFPGHGGVLDRFDSVVALAPLLLALSLAVTAFSGGELSLLGDALRLL